MKTYLAVAAGGAVGASGRYGFVAAVGLLYHPGFPIGTLIANVAGSFLMGALVEILALVWSPPEAVRAFLVVGVLGAFTTFSAFSMEAVTLLRQGATGAAVAYILASVILSLIGVFAGMRLLRLALT